MAWPKYVFIFVMPDADALSVSEMGLFVSLTEKRRWPQAVRFYGSLLQNNPDFYSATNALANVAYENRDFTAATGLLASLVKNNPGNPVWLNNLGVVAAGRGDFAVARGLLQQAIMVSGNRNEILYNLGCLAVSESDRESARKIFRQIIRDDPNHLQALFALSRIGKELGCVDEALACCRKLVELAPDEAEFRQNLGLLLLKSGDLEAGFKLYEARWHANRFDQFPADLLWQGEELTGKTILVWSEQGLGDTFNFVRYLHQLKELTEQVVLVVQDALLGLLRASFPDIAIMGLCDKERLAYDFQVPLLNLPRFFQTHFGCNNLVEAYLRVSERFKEKWQDRLVEDHRWRVGVVWAGNPDHANDLNRSISLKLFSPVLALEGASFYGLQKEPVAGDAQLLATLIGAEESRGRFIDFSAELDDFQDTAAILENLDLLISVDTSVAHLAGALARPTWLLLPFDADWRWLLERDDTPWYPTMRLFRQSTPGDWESVIETVRDRLEGVVNKKRRSLHL